MELSAGALGAALGRLAALGKEADAAALDGLRERLLSQRLRVLIAGEAKRGKSTLVNALLGRAVLPSGATPLTALPTTVRYGTEESVTAVFADRTERLPLAALGELVTERANPGNRKNVVAVTAWVDSPLLASGIELVDTPGTGSVFEHNTAAAETALATLDAAVFVLTADPPVSASERDLMERVAGLSATMFVVLNKTDYLPPQDTEEVLSFSADVVAGAADRGIRVYPVSALRALSARGDPGFAEFAAAFAAYAENGRLADLRSSVAAQAGRIARGLRDETELARRAGELVAARNDERVTAFAARLTAAAEEGARTGVLIEAESRRMLAGLNASAEEEGRRGTARVASAIEDLLAGELGSAPAWSIETAGRERLSELAVRAAEEWRQQQAAVLETGLTALDDRLTATLSAELEQVREAAAELLGVRLSAQFSGPRLAPDLRFFYQEREEAGQTELLAGAIRRRLPGEAGRNRAKASLRRETGSLVPQQFGRARADLQYRLAEAARRLACQTEARYEEGTSRLRRALDDAFRLREASAPELAARDAELDSRQSALDELIRLLEP